MRLSSRWLFLNGSDIDRFGGEGGLLYGIAAHDQILQIMVTTAVAAIRFATMVCGRRPMPPHRRPRWGTDLPGCLPPQSSPIGL